MKSNQATTKRALLQARKYPTQVRTCTPRSRLDQGTVRAENHLCMCWTASGWQQNTCKCHKQVPQAKCPIQRQKDCVGFWFRVRSWRVDTVGKPRTYRCRNGFTHKSLVLNGPFWLSLNAASDTKSVSIPVSSLHSRMAASRTLSRGSTNPPAAGKT